LEKLAAGHPALARALSETSDDPTWSQRLTRLAESWAWQRARAFCDRMLAPGREAKLEGELDEVEAHLRTTVEDLAADRALWHCMFRMTAGQKQALNAYANAVSRAGKGATVQGRRHLKAARSAMREARGAVPAWVMPVKQVAAMIEPTQNAFDVVIVDEASQVGRAGWKNVPDHDGSPRHKWTTERLHERQRQGGEDVERAILRLADRREYHGQEAEFKPTLEKLNKILAIEGLRVGFEAGRPVLVEQEPVFDATGARPPHVELHVSVTDVVSDPELAKAVQRRLDEAHIGYDHGAYISAVIMLGSLLEGVLLHVAETRPSIRPLPKELRNMGLQDLVEFAHVNGWIEPDAKMASNLVRHYRNSVHPGLEKRTKHSPNRDTLDMCWPVVNATFNDLAATSPGTTSGH
jgi:hypothetical protein